MKQYTMRLCLLMVYTVTNPAIAMNFESTMPVSVMNVSKGLTNNTYDIYVQVIPDLNASQTAYRELFIPYGTTKAIGTLANIRDIRTRGSSVMSCWTYNKDILNKARQEIKEKNVMEYSLRLSIIAGITGFYIADHNWVSRDSLTNSGTKYKT